MEEFGRALVGLAVLVVLLIIAGFLAALGVNLVLFGWNLIGLWY